MLVDKTVFARWQRLNGHKPVDSITDFLNLHRNVCVRVETTRFAPKESLLADGQASLILISSHFHPRKDEIVSRCRGCRRGEGVFLPRLLVVVEDSWCGSGELENG